MPSRTKYLFKNLSIALFAISCLTSRTAIASDGIMSRWSEKQEAKRQALYSDLTAAAFAKSVIVEDDELEPVAILSTRNGFQFKGGFTDTVRSDPFLRAFIDKKTGDISYQLYVSLKYTGPNRNFFLINYFSADGPKSSEITVVNRDAPCTGPVCLSAEYLMIPLPDSVVHSIAAKANQTPVSPWRFRLKSNGIADWNDDIPPAEAAGLLIAVDQWKTIHRR